MMIYLIIWFLHGWLILLQVSVYRIGLAMFLVIIILFLMFLVRLNVSFAGWLGYSYTCHGFKATQSQHTESSRFYRQQSNFCLDTYTHLYHQQQWYRRKGIEEETTKNMTKKKEKLDHLVTNSKRNYNANKHYFYNTTVNTVTDCSALWVVQPKITEFANQSITNDIRNQNTNPPNQLSITIITNLLIPTTIQILHFFFL